MHTPTFLRATTALLIAIGCAPAWAGSSASSASVDASSTSLGLASKSFDRSSDSSSGERKTAQGDYRIVEVAQAAQRPGTLRLQLQALAEPGAAGALVLYLPAPAAQDHQLAAGQVVKATPRPYGVEFAKAETPFFLVLDDDWYQGLQTRRVTL